MNVAVTPEYFSKKYEKRNYSEFGLLASWSPEVQRVFGLDRNQVRNHVGIPGLIALKSEIPMYFWNWLPSSSKFRRVSGFDRPQVRNSDVLPYLTALKSGIPTWFQTWFRSSPKSRRNFELQDVRSAKSATLHWSLQERVLSNMTSNILSEWQLHDLAIKYYGRKKRWWQSGHEVSGTEPHFLGFLSINSEEKFSTSLRHY